jgi:hypothetical protein
VEKDTIIAALGSVIGLAGVLLVFIGFVYAHGESFSNVSTKRKYQRVAKAGLAPFSIGLVAAWFCVRWLQWCGPTDYVLAILLFKGALISTLAYGIISVLAYL